MKRTLFMAVVTTVLTFIASGEHAEAASEMTNGEDKTSLITNNSFETGKIAPWTAASGYKLKNTSSTGKDGTYYFSINSYASGVTLAYVKQTLTGLTGGFYVLHALLVGNSGSTDISLYAGDAKMTKTFTQAEYTAGFVEYSTPTAVVDDGGSLEIGVTAKEGVNYFKCDKFTLTYYPASTENIAIAFSEAVTTADNMLNLYPEITGTARTELIAAKSVDVPTTLADYKTKVALINEKETAFLAAAVQYEVIKPFIEEVDRAEAMGVDVTSEKAQINDPATLATTIGTSHEESSSIEKNLNVKEYSAVKNNYADVTSKFGSTWTQTNLDAGKTGSHWSGNSSTGYWNQSNSAKAASCNQTIANLPAGKYVFMAAGRAGLTTSLKLTVTANGNTYESNFPYLEHGTGYGITTAGDADFDATGTYAETTGKGWRWKYVPFEITNAGDVKFDVTTNLTSASQWVSFSDMRLYKQYVKYSDETTVAPIAQTDAYVQLTRTFNDNSENWNTIVVPFDVADVTAAFGTNAKAATLTGANGTTLEFSSATALEANKPALIKGIASGTFTFSGVEVKVASDLIATAGNYKLTGTYNVGYIPQNSFYIANNKFYLADQANTVTLKGFRAYISSENTGAKSLTVSVDGEATGISLPSVSDNSYDIIYNLCGQRVNSDNLRRGVYIRNGQKFIIK